MLAPQAPASLGHGSPASQCPQAHSAWPNKVRGSRRRPASQARLPWEGVALKEAAAPPARGAVAAAAAAAALEPPPAPPPSTPAGPPPAPGEGVLWPSPGGGAFWDRPARSSPAQELEDSLQVPVERDSRSLRISHISAELAPIGKVGGLGDVVAGLSRACIARGHDVSVILPFYECLDNDQIEGLKHEMDLEVPKGFMWDGEMRVGSLRTSVFSGRVSGVPVFLVRPSDVSECRLFRGTKIYGGSYDDKEAYLYFCRAALEFLLHSGQQPDILQVHDWHSAAVPLLFWELYHGSGLHKPRIVMTIHNLENMGECRQDEFSYTGLGGERFADVDKALDERTIGHNPERLSLMKGGVIYSNAVSTVSPSYAHDIVHGGAGGAMRQVFNLPQVSSKFHGIVNGVDLQEWSPATDAVLPCTFNASHLGGKAVCKEFLQRGLGMAVDPSKPLVAVVSRLVGQKNPGLMQAAAYRCRDAGAQYVLLGSGGQEGGLRHAGDHDFKDHPDVRLLIMYSERLSRLIFAAADFVLVPSNFEPCGLTQLIAMRYGALPVVRRTGGLADTVRDVDTWQGPEEERNGFTFDGTDVESMHGALDRALALYAQEPQRFADLVQRGMLADVSWGSSAKAYVDLYTSVCRL